jgi:DNA-binding NarL/FixJ family response regulator
MQAIRILVADDHALLRNILCQLLGSQADFEIVCESVDASGAVEKTEEMQPDVVILDINLPDVDGLEVVRRIRAASPSTEILLCSEHAHMVGAGLEAGARGYLLKSDAVRELIAADPHGDAGREIHQQQINCDSLS